MNSLQSSLIITPPSLVSQWIDELVNNAPSLKVLIYDGWCKLKVPINKSDREIKRVASLTKKKKPKTKKAKGKAKAKRKADFDDDDSDSTDDFESVSETKEKVVDWAEYVHQYDVVITTYSVLRSEIWVARPPVDRPRREDADYGTYGQSRSPLVLVKWKRVVMDEVQMVGGGQAASVLHFLCCGSNC